MLTLYEYEQLNELMVAAHRGSSGTITENTLAAFEDAINSGVKIIELDIQMTADNQLVVYHDFHLPFSSQKISELKYDDIKNIKIGSEINNIFDSSHIPLLKDVLKLVKNRCYLMIEIKVNSDSNYLDNVEELIDLIIDHDYQKNTIFGSFSYSILMKIKSINSSIYTAAIKIPGDDRLPSQIRKETSCDAFICSLDEMSREIEENTLKNNIFLAVYTIDDDESLKKIMQYKVRAIATNYPEKILKLLATK